MIISLFALNRELGDGCEARKSFLRHARAELVMGHGNKYQNLLRPDLR